MNQLDVYYRALTDYRRQTLEDRSCTALRTAIASADAEQDKIVIKRAICTIDQAWIDAIEEGLVHVEKALKEERQFIRSNGEVIPIEMVKHVSKESVEHLAKHSNLITNYEEGEDVVPEKLYTVERLSDFAVYENRFLYMLLCYLRDFITIRYNDILDLSNRYEAEINFNKMISTGKERMTYTLSMHDIKRDDPYLKEINPAKDTIDRIHLLLKTVIAFLGTPLMQEVSKVAMLKPPITKTNVLKMNKNFKGAVALYEFIMAYNKKGYEVEESITTFAPFQDNLADELAEAGGLISFLVYEYGLAINKELKESYLREEERRKAEKIKQRADRIETLKRRLRNSEISIEEYTLTLEDQLRELSAQADRAERLANELAEEREKNKQLSRKIEMLTENVCQLETYIEELNHQHFLEIEALKRAHEEAMHELIVKHEEEIKECVERYEQEMRELNEKYLAELQNEKDAAAEAARRHMEELSAVKEKYNSELERERERFSSCSADLFKARAEYAELLENHRVSEARIKALGGTVENYTDRERFNELEREYAAFTRVYKEQWRKTKKEIKRKYLNVDNLKDHKEKKEEKEEEKPLTPTDENDA